MNILVVGNGGREHALIWKIDQSPLVNKIYCAPGNAGTGIIAENIDIQADDIASLAQFAETNEIDLTVVGPEAPLAAGIVDIFEKKRPKGFRRKQKSRSARSKQGLFKKYHEQVQYPHSRREKLHQL